MYIGALLEIQTRLRLGCRRSDSVFVLRGLRREEGAEFRIFSLIKRYHEYVARVEIARILNYVRPLPN